MERLRRVIPYLLPFPSDPASTAMHCAPAGHTPRSVSTPMISRSRCRWGTAASEITGIAHRSGGRVGDGFALIPPVFPRSSALSGRKPFPLEWECANLQQFLSEKIYLFCSERLACCRGNARIMVILGSFMHFQTVFTCLGLWLHLILNN